MIINKEQIGHLSDLIWRKIYEERGKKYKEIVHSVMKYALETKTETLETTQMFKTNDIHVLREIVGETEIE